MESVDLVRNQVDFLLMYNWTWNGRSVGRLLLTDGVNECEGFREG